MIHQLLDLKRTLFVFDTETTGTDVKESRIIELGFQQWGPEGLVKEWRSLIDPRCLIPKSASDVHHITDEDFMKCVTCGVFLHQHPIGLSSEDTSPQCIDPKRWPTFAEIAPSLAKGFVDCDFAGKNVRFDLRILSSEMQRANVPWSFLKARVIDAERLEQLAVPRTLSHLYEKYTGQKLEGAHGALTDAQASTTVLQQQLLIYDKLPRSLDELHRLQWPEEWLDANGSFRMINGVATIMFGKHRGKAMRGVDLSYYDWILRENFAEDIKALARQAKLGIFPD